MVFESTIFDFPQVVELLDFCFRKGNSRVAANRLAHLSETDSVPQQDSIRAVLEDGPISPMQAQIVLLVQNWLRSPYAHIDFADPAAAGKLEGFLCRILDGPLTGLHASTKRLLLLLQSLQDAVAADEDDSRVVGSAPSFRISLGSQVSE